MFRGLGVWGFRVYGLWSVPTSSYWVLPSVPPVPREGGVCGEHGLQNTLNKGAPGLRGFGAYRDLRI